LSSVSGKRSDISDLQEFAPIGTLVLNWCGVSSLCRTSSPDLTSLAETDETALVGRHTGIGFIVEDIDATYKELVEKGVEFDMPPTKQPWGGTLALLKDPEGNIFYLDPGHQ